MKNKKEGNSFIVNFVITLIYILARCNSTNSVGIKKGFLPWFYKDEWGRGGKLFVFRIVYVGIELLIIYALFHDILGKESYNWVLILFIVTLFWMTYDDKNEDEK